VRTELAGAEAAGGAARSAALTRLATALERDVTVATDKGRVRRLTRAVQDLARMQ
jgi:hypothetical protein